MVDQSPSSASDHGPRRSATSEALGLFLALAIAWATALVGSVLIARRFGPVGKGILARAMLARGYIALFVGFGLDSAIVQRAISRPREAATIVTTGIWLTLGLGGLAGAIGLFLARAPGLVILGPLE